MTRRLVLLLLCIVSLVLPAQASTILEATDSIEVVTSSAAALDYNASFADYGTNSFTPSKSAGAISSATTTTIVSAPSSGLTRMIKELTLRNTSTSASNTVTLQRDVSGSNRTFYSRTLGPGESIDMDANGTITPFDATGRPIVGSVDTSGINGTVFPFFKAGGAKDSAGYWYNTMSAAGFPGAASLQAPGLNGFTTDCSIASQTTDPNGAAQMGAHPLVDPASGSLYLKNVSITSAVTEMTQLIDVIWYNTGAVVTTTTGQTITMPTLPNRDINGSNNGAGWMAALWSTAANTNAAVVANTTITYTDQDGNSGNTGTFSGVVGWQAPATPVVGTWMPFQLAAGDTGIRSIQTLTLGTSYVTGSLSLVLYRVLATIPQLGVSTGAPVDLGNPGVKIYPNSCIAAVQVGSASAGNLFGSYTIMER